MLRILIAEDEEPIANLIRINLTRAGYQCTWAPDGQTAADLMEREKFDLALLDIMLPGINGYELMDYAKACELPVIFLTALGSTEHKVKGLRMGADDYLPKPFEIVELLARVEAVLRRYHKTETMIQVNNVTIDTASHRVTLDGEEIYLTIFCYCLQEIKTGLCTGRLYTRPYGAVNIWDRAARWTCMYSG